ncbi:hypothetical protein BDV12DRAFT_209569 [Aspergillus spectabilis]
MLTLHQHGFLIATALSLFLTPSPTLSNPRSKTTNFTCLPLTAQLSDPIVSPGQQSAHTNVVTGGTAFQRTMGKETAREAKGTTCEVAIDRSNYWVPALYHRTGNENGNGSFELVPYEWSRVIYTASATRCGNRSYPLAPPAGLRFVAGDPKLQTYNDSDPAQPAISYMGLKQSGTSKETKHLPRQACEKLSAQVFFPSCWDGENLDSPDHKSHMAYPAIGDYNKGICPKTHPVGIFSIFIEILFNTKPFPDYKNWVYAIGDRTGYGLHGKGWLSDPKCSITMTQKRPLSPVALQPEVSSPPDELGQNRTIQALPGYPEHAH